MEAPAPTPSPQIAVDPNLKAQQDAAQATLIQNLQVQAAGDTASIMTRFGTRLALGGMGAGTSPATPAAAPTPAPTNRGSFIGNFLNSYQGS